MNKAHIETYCVEAFHLGRTKQEIFNKIIRESDFKIHDLAEVIRTVPTLEKRELYKRFNWVLLSVLGLSLLSRILQALDVFGTGKTGMNPGEFLFLVIPGVMIYALFHFKRNMHLVTGILMLGGCGVGGIRLIFHFNPFMLADLLISFSCSMLAFWLHAKLTGDYVLNQDLLQNSPGQREDSVTFTG